VEGNQKAKRKQSTNKMSNETTDTSGVSSTGLLLLGALIVFPIAFWFFSKRGQASGEDSSATSSASSSSKKKKQPTKKGASTGTTKEKSQETQAKVVTIKEHSREVYSVDVSPDGNYVLTASEDRTLRLWSIASLLQKNPTHIRISTELDHATCCKFSPTLPSKPADNKDTSKPATTSAAPKGIYLVAVAMASSRSIHLYGIKDKVSC